MPVPVLFLTDTHLGLDLPAKPRVERPRRGEDFFTAFEQALGPATTGETGLVIHGGDLFYRSRIPAWLAARVFARLAALADSGVDVFWVPGNHERSAIPRPLLLGHPRIHVFDRPRTFFIERAGVRIALVGLPFAPRARHELPALLAAADWRREPADVRLLCLHQAVEGARVGLARGDDEPGRDFVFRDADEVVRCADLPAGFAAVLCGHVHRAQVLRRDLAGRPLPAPVLYAGSTERTSFAERAESKGALMLWLHADEPGSGDRDGGRATWERRLLPVPPMAVVELDPRGDAEQVSARLRAVLLPLDPRSVVRVRLTGEPSPAALPVLRAAAVRAAAPPTMRVEIAWPRDAFGRHEQIAAE